MLSLYRKKPIKKVVKMLKGGQIKFHQGSTGLQRVIHKNHLYRRHPVYGHGIVEDVLRSIKDIGSTAYSKAKDYTSRGTNHALLGQARKLIGHGAKPIISRHVINKMPIASPNQGSGFLSDALSSIGLGISPMTSIALRGVKKNKNTKSYKKRKIGKILLGGSMEQF